MTVAKRAYSYCWTHHDALPCVTCRVNRLRRKLVRTLALLEDYRAFVNEAMADAEDHVLSLGVYRIGDRVVSYDGLEARAVALLAKRHP